MKHPMQMKREEMQLSNIYIKPKFFSEFPGVLLELDPESVLVIRIHLQKNLKNSKGQFC